MILPSHAETAFLDGPTIDRALRGNTVKGTRPNGTPWSQYFAESGRTQYREGGAAVQTGRWEVRDNQYCSKWPPSNVWSCYQIKGDLANQPVTLTWLFADGDEWDGQVMSGNQF
ncbi:hypothetical protein [Coralliovum pocilloporae]|uniref:hypothetical protein n=1 Tax=Coralliovum pocilloporae TaxID=3066369 RepID=UPI0033077C70